MLARRVALRRGIMAVGWLLVMEAAAVSAQPVPKTPNDITGRWELTGRWKSDAISMIVELLAGGWYSQTLVASVHLQYEYNGARLVLTPLLPSGGPDSASRAVLDVRFDNDTLTATSPSDTIKMVRMYGGEFPGDIKGRWMLLGRTDATAVRQEFGPDGNLRVITTLSGEVGQYRIVGNEIEWTPMLPARASRKTKFKVAGDHLVLSSGNLHDDLMRLH